MKKNNELEHIQAIAEQMWIDHVGGLIPSQNIPPKRKPGVIGWIMWVLRDRRRARKANQDNGKMMLVTWIPGPDPKQFEGEADFQARQQEYKRQGMISARPETEPERSQYCEGCGFRLSEGETEYCYSCLKDLFRRAQFEQHGR